MLNFLYKVLLTLNSTSWMLVVYGIKQKSTLICSSRWITGIVLLLIPVILSILSIFIARFLENESEVVSCENGNLADNEFIPVYLGYFFVSLSVPDEITLIFLYGIIFIFTFLSQAEYVNPLYLLLGYHHYHVSTKRGTKIFVIIRHDVIRNWNNRKIKNLKRMNDTTYFVVKKEEINE